MGTVQAEGMPTQKKIAIDKPTSSEGTAKDPRLINRRGRGGGIAGRVPYQKGTQCTLSETVSFLCKRAAQSPTGSPNKTMKLDPKNHFSILDAAEEEEEEVANDEIMKTRKKEHSSSLKQMLSILYHEEGSTQEEDTDHSGTIEPAATKNKSEKKKGKKGKETSKDSKVPKDTNQKDQPGSPRNADETRDTDKPQGPTDNQFTDPPETSRDIECRRDQGHR